MRELRRSGTKRSLHWVLTALAIGALGCPDSSPPKTGLEPSSPVQAPAPPTDEQRYAGTYIYAGGEAERAGIKTAVDHATEGMVGKNIARGELMNPEVAQRLCLAIKDKAAFQSCVFDATVTGNADVAKAYARTLKLRAAVVPPY